MTPINGMSSLRSSPWGRASWVLAVASILCLHTGLARPGWAYTPDSPEVQKMLDRAIEYLNRGSDSFVWKGKKIGEVELLGGQCLVGLAAYKYNKRFGQDHDQLPALTQRGLTMALSSANKLTGENNYSVGLGLIFLCEIDAQDHIEAINAYLEELKSRQKPHGGWGYPATETGDLSQLQYAVLGLWAAKNAGLDVPDHFMADVVNYVLRVQDPSGAWGYQGVDPGDFFRVPQISIRPSLAVAGLGSLYVGADFLGMSKGGKPRTISNKKLPPALIPVVERDDRPDGRLSALVDDGRLKQAMEDGLQWLHNQPSLQTQYYQSYFIYGLERCQSFKEKVDGKYEEEPRWYNDGVRLLRDLQSDEGSWGVPPKDGTITAGCQPPIATAFSMLFLLRSTRETIEKVIERDGVLRGGYGLPGDLTELRVRNNQIVAPAIMGEVEDLITMLEDDEGEKIENMIENPDALSLSGMSGNGREFTARLARILRTGQSYKARIVAARTLGQQGDLDNVPILIFALTDPDPRVAMEAQDGLRRISCKFDGFGLAEKPTPDEFKAVVTQWKAWYKSVRPDAVFIQ